MGLKWNFVAVASALQSVTARDGFDSEGRALEGVEMVSIRIS